MNLRNILINMTKNKVNWNKQGVKRGVKQEQNTHVFDTTARLVK